VALLVLSGCASASGAASTSTVSSSASSVVTAPSSGAAGPSASSTNPYGEMTIDPAGPHDPVLTVTGGRHGALSLTLAGLEALGTTAITVDEPFVKRRESFTGVPMSAVLDRAGISGTTRINTHALNDYDYANIASAFTDSHALIATHVDGAAIPLDQGGPIRIVFPDGTPLSDVLDAWNWSLQSIAPVASGG
jgi:hypothetical protein